MRLLLHGLQASGASVTAAWLAQRPGCIALIDVPFSHITPFVAGNRPIVAKAVITTAYAITEHQERFEADKTVLIVRNPVANWLSLSRKGYRDDNGLMEEKFVLADAALARVGKDYDLLIRYEDLEHKREDVRRALATLGWPLPPQADAFRKDQAAILSDLFAHAPGAAARFPHGFGDWREGGFRFGPNPEAAADVIATVSTLCPRLMALYAEANNTGRPKLTSLPGRCSSV